MQDNILAGNFDDNHVYLCPAGQVHLNYSNVDICFCREGFLTFSEVVSKAIDRITREPCSKNIFLTCGYVTLKVPREDSGNLEILIKEAVVKLCGAAYVLSERKN